MSKKQLPEKSVTLTSLGEGIASVFQSDGKIWNISAACVRKLSKTGGYIETFGFEDDDERNLDLASNGNVVYRLSTHGIRNIRDGKKEISLKRWRLQEPKFIAISKDSQRLYVYLNRTHKVICFNSAGKYIESTILSKVNYQVTSFSTYEDTRSILEHRQGFLITGAPDSSISRCDRRGHLVDIKVRWARLTDEENNTMKAPLLSAIMLPSGHYAVVHPRCKGVLITGILGLTYNVLGSEHYFKRVCSFNNGKILAMAKNSEYTAILKCTIEREFEMMGQFAKSGPLAGGQLTEEQEEESDKDDIQPVSEKAQGEDAREEKEAPAFEAMTEEENWGTEEDPKLEERAGKEEEEEERATSFSKRLCVIQ